MADLYARFTEVEAAAVANVTEAMEMHPADSRYRAMLDHAADVALPRGTRVLEVGCGSGTIARLIARDPRVREVVGVDSSPLLVSKARHLAAGDARLRFDVADGTALSFGASSKNCQHAAYQQAQGITSGEPVQHAHYLRDL